MYMARPVPPRRLVKLPEIDDADVWLAKGVFAGTAAGDAAWAELQTHPEFDKPTPKVKVWGKEYDQPRDTASMAIDGCPPYNYSGSVNTTIPMPPATLALKNEVERLVYEQTDSGHVTFNYCLCNRYRDGKHKIGKHSDSEVGLEKGRPIACVSLGATRRFIFRHKATGRKVEILLEHGDLLVMGRNSQLLWTHEIPQELRVKEPRVSVTFRCVC